jgi:chaperonin GroES
VSANINFLEKKGENCMKFKPLRDRVLVKYSEESERTAGGLYIPDTAKEKSQKGEIVAVGPGKITDDGKLQPISVKVGDIVLFDKYSGSKVTMDDVEYLIIREEDILGIVEK